MGTAIVSEPVSAAAYYVSGHRPFAKSGERTILADSTSGAPASGNVDAKPTFSPPTDEKAAEPAIEQTQDRGSEFAAAVIAGAFPPTPKSFEEVIRRIGSVDIPEESQARLRDLLA